MLHLLVIRIESTVPDDNMMLNNVYKVEFIQITLNLCVAHRSRYQRQQAKKSLVDPRTCITSQSDLSHQFLTSKLSSRDVDEGRKHGAEAFTSTSDVFSSGQDEWR